MRKWKLLIVSAACGVLSVSTAQATPSTTFWTTATTDVVPFGTVRFMEDTYFTIGRRGSKASALPIDVGLTAGVLPFKKLNAEVGVDLLEPTDDPLFFNGKLGTPEGTLFDGSPALNLGIFNVGTRPGVTDYDIGDFLVGKTLPHDLGRLFAGAYYGSSTLRSSSGERQNVGWMIGYDRGFCPVKQGEKEYKRFVLAADYASGKNTIGGGGVGLYVYFTPDISVLTGPVWFNDPGLNGDFKWTVQVYINF